jgi:hypothetical protein
MQLRSTLVALFGLLGCTHTAPEATPSEVVTWYEDVQPLAAEHCARCHDDDTGPFSMERWTPELAARAPLMAALTASGAMPPWMPSPDCNSYEDERILPDGAAAVFAAWAAGGAIEGDPAGAVPVDETAALPWVDRTLEPAGTFTPSPANGEVDLHRCFGLDLDLGGPEVLVGYQVHPGDARVVHHVLLYLVEAGAAGALENEDGEPGYACKGGVGVPTSGPIAGWAPGAGAAAFPEGTGVPLPADAGLVMQVHYNTAAAGPQPDRTTVELQLAREPVDRLAQILSLADHEFSVPPGAHDHHAGNTIEAPASGRIWAVAPHMHGFGREIRVAIDHGAESSCLVDVPAWDFNWQQFYFLRDPIAVTQGDAVTLTCVFDNESSEPLTWGEKTGDEMCLAYFYATE